jgi:GAF domain-containing protein
MTEHQLDLSTSPLNRSVCAILSATSIDAIIRATEEAAQIVCGKGDHVRAWLGDDNVKDLPPATPCEPTTIMTISSQGADGRVFGSLALYASSAANSSVLDTLASLAAVAGAAIGNVYLKEAAARADIVSSALCDAAHLSGFASTLRFDDLLMHITELTIRLVATERVTVFLADESREELYCVECRTADLKQVLRVPFGRGIAGTVAATRKLLRVADAYTHPAFDRSTDERTGYRTRAVLCVPILLPSLAGRGPRLLGVLQARVHEGVGEGLA